MDLVRKSQILFPVLAEKRLSQPVVQEQLELLRMRNTFPAFGFDSQMQAEWKDSRLSIRWAKDGYAALLQVNLQNYRYEVQYITPQEV